MYLCYKVVPDSTKSYPAWYVTVLSCCKNCCCECFAGCVKAFFVLVWNMLKGCATGCWSLVSCKSNVCDMRRCQHCFETGSGGGTRRDRSKSRTRSSDESSSDNNGPMNGMGGGGGLDPSRPPFPEKVNKA